MSTIGGPKGPEGPRGPAGPTELDEPAESDAAPSAASALAGQPGVAQAGAAARAGDVDALAAEIAAGRLTPQEAIERLVDATAGPELDAADRAELRELLMDLVANDPHLGALAGRI